jgi:hypothetical protein
MSPPVALMLDMHLTRRMHEAEESPGHDRNQILFVIHMPQATAIAVQSIDVVCKGAVAHARHTVADYAHTRSWGKMQWEVDRVGKRKRRAERMSCEDDG